MQDHLVTPLCEKMNVRIKIILTSKQFYFMILFVHLKSIDSIQWSRCCCLICRLICIRWHRNIAKSNSTSESYYCRLQICFYLLIQKGVRWKMAKDTILGLGWGYVTHPRSDHLLWDLNSGFQNVKNPRPIVSGLKIWICGPMDSQVSTSVLLKFREQWWLHQYQC